MVPGSRCFGPAHQISRPQTDNRSAANEELARTVKQHDREIGLVRACRPVA